MFNHLIQINQLLSLKFVLCQKLMLIFHLNQRIQQTNSQAILFNFASPYPTYRTMLTANLAKSIISKSLLTKALAAVYSTSGQQKTFSSSGQKYPQRQLKAYEKLFYSSPIMNINIEMIMAINQLRPKATYIIAIKNGVYPKQISNSTFNIVECLNYIQGFKYFYKSFPALVENITKIMNDKLDFAATGIFKPNTIKKMIQMISHVDCLHGERFSEMMSVFLIWCMQSSMKTKHTLTELTMPLKQRLGQIKQKRRSVFESRKGPQDDQTIAAIDQEISKLQNEISKLIYKNKFIKEEDFLCALHYCLERGYYSEAVLKEFVENILEKNNYALPDFEAFLKEEEEFFFDMPLPSIFNRRALIYSRMYSNVIYRFKILNDLKKLKLHDPKFMEFLKKSKTAENTETSESSSEDSPFINGEKIDESSSSESHSEQKSEHMSAKLIEETLIPKKAYLNLVNSYLQLFERKDVLCYILSQEQVSQSFRVIQTEFFSYLNDQSNSSERLLTLSDVKAKYLTAFKGIFDIEKNGSMFAESLLTEGAFEAVLRMYDYGDRKEIYELLKIYERFIVSKKIQNLKSLAPFYVFEKYGYRSNFIASKLFEYISLKNRVQKNDSALKQELILSSNEICRYLSLYFKLLEDDLASLFSAYDMGANIKARPKQEPVPEGKQLSVKYQMEFQQAIEIFLNNYNKIISVVYLEKENSGFIGKGLELSFEYLKSKFLSTKPYEQAMYVDGKIPEDDIRKIIFESGEAIRSHRSYVKNVYEKEFLSNSLSTQAQSAKTQLNSPLPEAKEQQASDFTFNPYFYTLISRKNPYLNPLDQVSTLLEIVETAVELQTLKNMEFYEDVMVIFKSIFENKKLAKIITNNQTFPQILKRMIRITQMFKGSYKNEGNKLFESILDLTGFNLNSFLHTSRISIARELINADKSVPVEENFQPYLHSLELNPKMEQSIRVWPSQSYQINKQNVVSHIRSDILHSALIENAELQKVIRDELAKIKTVKPNDKVKNIKFQLNYLEYPYLANVAINKSNELVVVIAKRQTPDSDKPYNAVLNKYYQECEEYFKKKGNRVIVATNEHEIRICLRELIK